MVPYRVSILVVFCRFFASLFFASLFSALLLFFLLSFFFCFFAFLPLVFRFRVKDFCASYFCLLFFLSSFFFPFYVFSFLFPFSGSGPKGEISCRIKGKPVHMFVYPSIHPFVIPFPLLIQLPANLLRSPASHLWALERWTNEQIYGWMDAQISPIMYRKRAPFVTTALLDL